MHKDNLYYQSRAKAMYITRALIKDLLNEVPRSPLANAYRSTYNCSSVLVIGKDGKARSTYCKQRWCAVCGQIRGGKAINEYESEVAGFVDGRFVTLTRRTVLGSKLAITVEEMEQAWRKILQSREAKKRKIRGIRKAECNAAKGNRYHYHFHVIIEGKENAEWLVKKWLESMGSKATRSAQDIREIDNGSVKELFKYATKIIAKSEVTSDGELVSASSLDLIYRAVKNKRMFQTFGDIKAVQNEAYSSKNQSVTENIDEMLGITDGDEVVYYQEERNGWFYKDGRCFVEYKPTKELTKILSREPKILVEA